MVLSSYAAYPFISQQYSGANEDYHIIKEIPNESTFFYLSNLDRDINTGAVTKWVSARHNTGGNLVFSNAIGAWEQFYLVQKGQNEYT